VQLIARFISDQVDERLNLLGTRCAPTDPFKHIQVSVIIEERQMVPALETFVAVCRGDGFELDHHLFEAALCNGIEQSPRNEFVVGAVCPVERWTGRPTTTRFAIVPTERLALESMGLMISAIKSASVYVLANTRVRSNRRSPRLALGDCINRPLSSACKY
jgi:hypothetical protein